MKAKTDIYVVVDHFRGEINSITYELLGKARELATQSGGSCIAILLGHSVEAMAGALGIADKVVYIEAPELKDFTTGAYAAALKAFFATKDAWLLLVGSTSGGLDIGTLVAHGAEAGLLVNTTAVTIEGAKLVAVTQVYAGKVKAEVELAGDKNVILCLPGAFPESAGKKEGAPAVTKVAPGINLSEVKMSFQEYILPEAGDIDITRESVLVSIGRGIQSDSNISEVEELAKTLGGALAASRPVIDQGWLPLTRQVGKSGMTVKPKLYLALGISGAPEHVEGMKDSELIVAVNSDANAPIFNFAHYGIVADMMDVVDALKEKLG